MSDFELHDDSAEIVIGRGMVVTIDKADYELVKDITWYPLIVRGLHYAYNRNTGVLMHRLVTNAPVDNAPVDRVVDHINGDGMDNRKSNLRLCTHADNIRNRVHINKNNRVGYRGVFNNRSKTAFVAQIKFEGKSMHLGTYPTAVEASRVHEEARLRLFGEYA
jgi:hypothetical protein